ncbi:MAG TPA: CoA transferase [Myxococcota bacterium]|nr:CoA transferase [Myxococcota bacterium]
MKRLPLDGVRVADLSMMWAGPFATRLLAEMGAEIVKIESPRAWDNVRTLLPQPGATEPWNTSFYFNDYNRDKKSLTLDLSQPRGKELFLELVAKCDCVIENYRADVLDKLGIGWDVLRAANPGISLVSMAGFGKTGPEKGLVGFGPIIEQMAGMASTTGYGDDGIPYKTGISYGDPIGGISAAGAVVLALIQRRRTGRGAWIDLAQRETMAQMLGPAFAAASLRGETPVHRGNRDPRFAPQGVYRALGRDQWVAISAQDDAAWRALARTIGAGALDSLSLEERRARHDELDRRIEAWTSRLGPREAAEALQRGGVAAAPVLDANAIHQDPHLAARGAWVELPHPKMKSWKQPASAWRLVEAKPLLRRHAPLFGEHNREILCGLLGHAESELEPLRAAGIIGDAPIGAREG